MIRRVWSDRSTFKSLEFKPGLNIVLAARAPTSTDEADVLKRTRNGSGKSSLVDIIRFMFGGDISPNNVLSANALQKDTFFVTFDMLGAQTTVSRSPSTKGRIDVLSDFHDWPIRPHIDNKTNQVSISRTDWNELLGRTFFGLRPNSSNTPRTNLTNSSCLAFFARRSRDSAFEHWALTHRSQSALQQAIPLFHLLGLDPEVVVKFVRLAETRKAASELKRAMAEGLITEAVGSRGHLRNELVKARRRADRVKSKLAGAEVTNFYGDYEREAAAIETQLQEIADANYVDLQLAADLRQATATEQDPKILDIDRLFKEANIVLPEVSLRRYDEVQAFHEAIIQNRRAHLFAEIDTTERRLRHRAIERDRLISRHIEISDIITTTVSWTHYRKLERELAEAEAAVIDLTKRLDIVEKLEKSRVDLKAEQVAAEKALQSELIERNSIVEAAINYFQNISAEIYKAPAEFDIEATARGPLFKIRQPAQMADGINQMQIFTFDMMLCCMSSDYSSWPGFLLHDSAMFDPVDPRQTGSALMLAHKQMLEIGGQYIVTLNSDQLKKAEEEAEVDLSSFVVDPVLTDRPGGGLFGFEFEHDISDAAAESEI